MTNSEKLVEKLLLFAEIDLAIKDNAGNLDGSVLRTQSDKNDKDVFNALSNNDNAIIDSAYHILSDKKANFELMQDKSSTDRLSKQLLIYDMAQDYIVDHKFSQAQGEMW